MSDVKHTPGLGLVGASISLERARNTVRDCISCIDASTPPAFCKRCTDCIDDDERPNWFPKNGADLEYLSWFPPRAAIARSTAPAPADEGVK